MGGSESKVQVLNSRLNYRFDKINIDELDSLFSETFPLVKDVEICRCEFLQRWNEFKRLSGAVVLLHPRFESCIQGMLFKLAADMNGTLGQIEFFDTDPFFQSSLPLKGEDATLVWSFQEVCRYYATNNDKVYKMEAELQKQHREVKMMRNDPETMFTDKYNVAPINVSSYNRKLNQNAKKIHAAYDCVVNIRATFEDIRKCLIRYASISRVSGQFESYESIGAEANRKKITKPTAIMFKYSREEKVTNYEDHFDFVQDDIKAEKEARATLEEFMRETNNINIRVSQTIPLEKKGSRLPTQQSSGSAFRKETEASQTYIENIPVEQQREVIIRKESDRELSAQAYEQPQMQVPLISKTKEYIVSDRETKPQNHIDYQYQNQIEVDQNKDIGMGLGVYLKKPSSSNIQTERQFDESFPQNQIESKPSKKPSRSEIINQKENKDYESIIQKLTRQNEELQSRLLQSIQPSQTTEKIDLSHSQILEPEKIITSTTSFPSKQRYSVFIRHHVPLKSSNLIMKKSVNASLHESIKSIETALDLEMIITGLKNGKIMLWNYTNLASIKETGVHQISEGAVKTILYLNDGRTILCGTKDGKLVKCNLQPNFEFDTVCELDTPIVALANPLNGISILAASGGKIYEIDIHNKTILNSIDAHDNEITDLVFNQQKEIMCSCGKDKFVKIWNSNTKELLGILQGHNDIIKSLCFAYTQNHLILCSVAKDSYLTLWNLSDKSLTKSLKMNSPARKVMYMWDKRHILSVHPTGFIYLWNLENAEKKEFSSKGHYSSCSYGDDGHNIFIGTDEGTLEFWNAK